MMIFTMLYMILNRITICYLPIKNRIQIQLKSLLFLILSSIILILSYQIWAYIGVVNIDKNGHNQPMHFSIPIVPSNVETFMFKEDSKESLQFIYTRNKKVSKAETRVSIKLAKDMILQNRPERAHKIFLHALALDSSDPDLLTAYGEFLETFSKDVVAAEHHYCKALQHSPAHTKALANRKRTLPLVEKIDQTYYSMLDAKRDALRRVPEGHPGMRRMIAENYFRHIYHTNAMEGNTFTLSQTRSFVENRIVISGKSIIEHQEILGMEAALHFINQSLPKRMGSLHVQDILDIHRRVLGFVDPIGSGIFRNTQVFVGSHVPPPADQIEALMYAFINWLNSEPFIELHPIEMAALAHYKLVYIHPFYDGNGRTSRLLMNLILMMAGYPPIIIPVHLRQDYYAHIETANMGDVRPFIRFIAACAERTLDEYIWSAIDKIESPIKGQITTKPSYDISKIFNHDFFHKSVQNDEDNFINKNRGDEMDTNIIYNDDSYLSSSWDDDYIKELNNDGSSIADKNIIEDFVQDNNDIVNNIWNDDITKQDIVYDKIGDYDNYIIGDYIYDSNISNDLQDNNIIKDNINNLNKYSSIKNIDHNIDYDDTKFSNSIDKNNRTK